MNEKIKVPEGWEVKKLGEIIDKLIDYRGKTPKKLGGDWSSTGYKVLSAKNVKKGKIINNESIRYINEDLYKKWMKDEIQKGDILLTSEAPLGEVYYWNSEEKIVLGQRLFGIRVKKGINSRYIYYYFSSHFFQKELKRRETGTTAIGIRQKELVKTTVILPSLPEQEKIADILGSIDDQIENLMEQNKTLEEMAETLFKEWIIKMDNENWDKRPLDKIAIFLNGLPCQKYPPKNDKDKLPVLKIKELQNGVNKNSDWASSEIPSEYIVQNGDVVFSWSGTLMVKIWNGEKCFLNQHLFKVFSKDYPKWFYYFWIKHYLKHFIAIAKSKATTMGHIKRKDLSKALIKVPSHEELKKMDKILSPMIEKIITNNRKIQTLTQLRDTLVPKLITGEIRVKV